MKSSASSSKTVEPRDSGLYVSGVRKWIERTGLLLVALGWLPLSALLSPCPLQGASSHTQGLHSLSVATPPAEPAQLQPLAGPVLQAGWHKNLSNDLTGCGPLSNPAACGPGDSSGQFSAVSAGANCWQFRQRAALPPRAPCCS